MFDTHTHISSIAPDPEQARSTVDEAVQCGVSLMINPGSDAAASAAGRNLAEAFPQVWFAAGFHPEILNETQETAGQGTITDLKDLASVLGHAKCLAAGEIGLDYFHNKSNKDDQKKLFISQVELAAELGMPLIIHCREAWDDTLEILARYRGKLNGIFHCFSGGPDTARKCLDLGYFISFAGNLTYKKTGELRESALYCPPERVFLETDAPYLTPVPLRGQPNRPAYVKHVYDHYCGLRGITVEEAVAFHEKGLRSLFPKISIP
jgi:TatD DNase family protein